MVLWECQSCGHRYDPAVGDAAAGIVPGTPFQDLPPTWRCPGCRVRKAEFEEVDPELEEDDVDESEGFDDFDDDGGLEDDGSELGADEDEDPAEEEDDELSDDAADDSEELEEEDPEEDDEELADDELDDDGEEDDFGEEDEDEDDGLEDFESDDELGAAEEESDEEPDEESEDDEAVGLEDDEDYGDQDEDEDEDEDAGFDEDPVDDDTRYICTDCGWIYDPVRGNPESGISAGTPFDDLSDEWSCPSCGAGQSRFIPHEDAPEPVAPAAVAARSAVTDDRRDLEALATTGRPSVDPHLPQRLHPGLSELLFRPGPLFSHQLEEGVTALTLIGPRAEKPLHLTTPLVVAPMPFGPLTNALKTVMARGTARVGTACTSGGPTLPEARRAAAVYILEVAAGRPAPGPEELQASDAAEIILSRGWSHLEDELVPGRSTAGVLAPINSPEELMELAQALRRSLRGPVGVRLPAGAIEIDLENVMRCRPDYVVLEGYGAGSGLVPRHVREHAYLPAWLAVHRARMFLDNHGFEGVGLLVAGDPRTPADFAKLLALGADAVLISTAAVVAMGLWDLRPGGEGGPTELLELRFDANAAVERLVNFLRAATEEITDFCRLVGKTDVHDLDRSDLLTNSEELARALGLDKIT